MSFWDDNGGWISGIAGGLTGYFGNQMFGGGSPVQDTTSVKGIGAGQNVDAQGGVNLGAVNLPYFQEDRTKLQQMMNGRTPFAGNEWGNLISQLQARANGTGPSVAQQNYNMASQDTTGALSSMSRGSANPDAARQAMIQQGRVGQGQAAGLALAGTQEQQAAQQGLSQSLSTRDQINQNAYMGILAQQLGLSQGQLGALRGDQAFITGQNQTNQADEAAKYAALASLLGTVAKAKTGGVS